MLPWKSNYPWIDIHHVPVTTAPSYIEIIISETIPKGNFRKFHLPTIPTASIFRYETDVSFREGKGRPWPRPTEAKDKGTPGLVGFWKQVGPVGPGSEPLMLQTRWVKGSLSHYFTGILHIITMWCRIFFPSTGVMGKITRFTTFHWILVVRLGSLNHGFMIISTHNWVV